MQVNEMVTAQQMLSELQLKVNGALRSALSTQSGHNM